MTPKNQPKPTETAQPPTPEAQAFVEAEVVQEVENQTANIQVYDSGLRVSRVNAERHIDLSGVLIEERLEALEVLFPPDKFNVVNFQQVILADITPGIIFVPVVVKPRPDDIWTKENAPMLIQDANKCEPSARLISQLGDGFGVRLEKTFEGEIEVADVPHYQVLYKPILRLPDGREKEFPESGKAMPLKNHKDQLQAHIIESTRIKAERNAYKRALYIPTIMGKNQALKPWVGFKVIYQPGLSEETDRLIENQEARKDHAVAMLYPGTPSLDELKAKIESASSPADLNALTSELEQVPLTGAQRKELGGLFKAKLAELEAAAKTPEPKPEPTVGPANEGGF